LILNVKERRLFSIPHFMPRKKNPSTDPAAFGAALVAWFRKEGRDYPWRRTRDPYAILVSEIMLQQTQIATVLDRGYYARWMERFPDFKALAAAGEAEILKTWEGLGYYRRARNLQKLARAIVTEHDGELPRALDQILALPGIGPYTAGALASFAYNDAAPLVDGNVARVFARLQNDATPVDTPAGQKKLWALAAHLVAHTSEPRLYNSALMELGQTICKTGTPDCTRCPVRAFCAGENPAELPVKQGKTAITAVTERVFFHETAQGVLLEQETGARRTGLWKLPALPEGKTQPPVILKTSYGITRYKVTLWVHEAPRGKPAISAPHRHFNRAELFETAMPSPYRKALEAVMRDREFRLA
jgi:A/G-specific adenine glycosylase